MSISHNKHYVNFGNGAGVWGLTGFTNGGSRPLDGRVLRPGSPGGDNGICRPGSPGGDNGICRPGSPGGDNGVCRPGSPAETTAFAENFSPPPASRTNAYGPGPVRVTAGPLRQALPSRPVRLPFQPGRVSYVNFEHERRAKENGPEPQGPRPFSRIKNELF